MRKYPHMFIGALIASVILTIPFAWRLYSVMEEKEELIRMVQELDKRNDWTLNALDMCHENESDLEERLDWCNDKLDKALILNK